MSETSQRGDELSEGAMGVDSHVPVSVRFKIQMQSTNCRTSMQKEKRYCFDVLDSVIYSCELIFYERKLSTTNTRKRHKKWEWQRLMPN